MPGNQRSCARMWLRFAAPAVHSEPWQHRGSVAPNHTVLRIAKAGSTNTLSLIEQAKEDNPRMCAGVDLTAFHTRFVRHGGIIVMREPSERFFSAYAVAGNTHDILTRAPHGDSYLQAWDGVVKWAQLLQADAALRAYWLAAPTHSLAWETDSHTGAQYGRYVSENSSVVVTRAACRQSRGDWCGFVPQADYYYVSGETRVLCLPSVREGMQRVLNDIAPGCKLRPQNVSATLELPSKHRENHSLAGGPADLAAELRSAVAALYPRDYKLWRKYCAPEPRLY